MEYLKKGATSANCSGTPEAPTAAVGYLCVYNAFEKNEPPATPPTVAILNAAGESGKASSTGASVAYTVHAPESLVVDAGSWAVNP